MNRRKGERIKRRIPCEFDYEGRTHNGIVVDLSARGVLLQTELIIDPGCELGLRLRAEQGEVAVRGRVARRRFTPAVLASLIRRGVGVRLVDVPPAYFELLGIAPEADVERVFAAVPREAPEAAPGPAPGPFVIDLRLEAEATLPLVDASPERMEDEEAGPFGPFEAPAPAPEEPEAALASAWEAPSEPGPTVGAAGEPPAAASWPPSLHRADALLIDEGELDDVHALLEAVGADPIRQRTPAESGFSFTGWEVPPRLIVASARSALRLSVGPKVEAQGIVTVVVLDSASQTLAGMLRRRGFRYLVRRPVHREALRLLLLRGLFRGRERRDAPRVPFGCEIALRLGLAPKPATLLELSRSGCRLLTAEWLDPGDRLGLRIPPAVTGNRPLGLAARVVRSERRRGAEAEQRVALALRFDRLAPEQRARIEALLAAHALGPPPLVRSEGATEDSGAEPTRGASLGASGDPSAPDRRRGPRAPHRTEVLALDPDLRRVCHSLLGLDLSPAGIRVEPHPELVIGDVVKLALHDAACDGSLTVEAEVARDDGPRGLWLRFAGLDAEAERGIARILARAPQLESAAAAPGEALVLAELVSAPSV